MITTKLTELPKSTVELEISITWDEVKPVYEKMLDKVASELELPGFRKGKAPKELVDKNINRTKLYEEIIREIVPRAYQEAITKNNLRPVSAPKVEVVKAKENESWLIKAVVALKPKINLKNYKEKIRSVLGSKPKIWTPKSLDKKEENKKPPLEAIVKTLLDEVEVEFSDLLISEEANRLLSNLVDQTQKLGLTVEQYLMAKGKTTEQIRAEYAQTASANLKFQFAIMEIADTENITVTQKDIDDFLAKIENEQEKERLKKDYYYLAYLLRQQKTLDFLYNL